MSSEQQIKEITDALSHVIKEKREEAGLSMNRLAQDAGLVVQAVAFIENGDRRPNIETIIRLSFALGTTPSKLLSEAEAICGI